MISTPPNDINAERGVVASCIIDPDCIGKCMDRDFDADTFYHPAHKLLFRGLVDLWHEGVDIDELTLADKMKSSGWLDEIGGLEGINTLSGAVETSLHFDVWAELIENHSANRKLLTLCNQTLDSIHEGRIQVDALISTMDSEILRISKERFKAQYFHDSPEAVRLAIRAMERRKELRGKLGIPAGIKELDVKLKGFKNTELTLIAARPSVGKTAFSLHIMKEAAVVNKIPTLYMSIEMSVASLMTRLIQSMAKVPIHFLDEDFVNENQQKAIDQAERQLKTAPFWVDETPCPSVAQIRARARRLKASKDLGLVIIDYLQLVRPRDLRLPREQQVAEISNSLKNLAKELDIPIILLCQLNRQSEIAGRAPKLSDLRESGQLEQDADVVLLLWKPDAEEPNKIQCTISKNRNGPAGSALLNFQKDTQRFVPYEEEEYPETETKQPRFGK